MKRFLSTTAVLLTLSGTAAYAETHVSNFGSVTAQQGDFYASDLIGMRVHNSQIEIENNAIVADDIRAEWEDIGEINDLIVSTDGEVTAVILGVGGFLGMGERDVSVSMDEIRMINTDGNDQLLVVTTTREELEAAPAYERDMNASDTTSTNTTSTDMASETAIDRPLLMRPTIEREGFQQAEIAELEQLTAEKIQGSYVYGVNDETVGEIGELLMNEDGKVEQIVINVGGFLGLGEKPVAVTFEELNVLRDKDGDEYRFYIDSTQEALEAQPEYEG